MTICCPNLLYYLDSQQLYVGIQIVLHPFIQLIVQRFSLCQSAAWEIALCGLICISLITKEVIILFTCLLTILISGTVKFKSLPILPLDCVIFFFYYRLTNIIHLLGSLNFCQLYGMELYQCVAFISLDLWYSLISRIS